MKIILLADVYKHGVAGEVVEVADGFARNYLIPKKLATQANDTEMKRFASIRKAAEARRLQYENMLNELGRKIDGTELVFFRRAANTGKLFGSVTTAEIAVALDKATSVDINRRRISQQPLRDTGLHQVPVRLGTDVSPVLNIRIVAEDQQIEYERQLAAVEEGILDEIRYTETGSIIPVNLDKIRAKQEKAAAEATAEEEIETAREIEEAPVAEAAPVDESTETAEE